MKATYYTANKIIHNKDETSSKITEREVTCGLLRFPVKPLLETVKEREMLGRVIKKDESVLITHGTAETVLVGYHEESGCALTIYELQRIVLLVWGIRITHIHTELREEREREAA